jgi:hypothetical protein
MELRRFATSQPFGRHSTLRLAGCGRPLRGSTASLIRIPQPMLLDDLVAALLPHDRVRFRSIACRAISRTRARPTGG